MKRTLALTALAALGCGGFSCERQNWETSKAFYERHELHAAGEKHDDKDGEKEDAGEGH